MWWIAAAQMAMDVYGGARASREARRASGREADAYYTTATEEIRRLARQQKTNLSTIKAGIGASGLTMDGAQARYYSDIDLEQGRQLRYAWRVRDQNTAAILSGGQAQADAIQTQANLSAINTGLSAIADYYKNKG